MAQFNQRGDFERTDLIGTPARRQLAAGPQTWLERLKESALTTRAIVPFGLEAWDVYGLDVSSWQGLMDWAIAKSRGISFSYLRAGIGNNILDPQLDNNVRGCVNQSIPYGLYWFIKPDKSWETTANSFAGVWQTFGGSLYPVFDIEVNGGLSKAALDSWVQKCLNKFLTTTGLNPAKVSIYTSPGFWNVNMPRTDYAKHYHLWNAHWTNAQQPIIPLDWSVPGRTWKFWQWSANGNGKGAYYGAQSSDIDLDRYNGTPFDFEAEFGASVPPVTPPLETPIGVIKPLQYGMRVRETFNGSATILYSTGYSDQPTHYFNVYEVKQVPNTGGLLDTWVRLNTQQWAALHWWNGSQMVYLLDWVIPPSTR